MNNEQSYTVDAVRINCAEWYAREDFQKWLRGDDRIPGPAMWGSPKNLTEFSDVFMTFEFDSPPCWWGGSDTNNLLPEDIYQEIGRELYRHGKDAGLVWLANMECLQPGT